MSDTLNESEWTLHLTEEQKKMPFWERILDVAGPVPPEERDRMPHDGAENHDHYLYGAPKKEHR